MTYDSSIGSVGAGGLERLARARVEALRPEGKEGVAARQFEAILGTMLVRELRESMTNGMFEGTGSGTYGDWFDQHLGQSLADADAFGLARTLRASVEAKAQAEGGA